MAIAIIERERKAFLFSIDNDFQQTEIFKTHKKGFKMTQNMLYHENHASNTMFFMDVNLSTLFINSIILIHLLQTWIDATTPCEININGNIPC